MSCLFLTGELRELIDMRTQSAGVKGSGNLRKAVQLPEGEDLNEWLAVHGASINNTQRMPAYGDHAL